MKYKVILPNGVTVTRNSNRIYTYAVASKYSDGSRQLDEAARLRRCVSAGVSLGATWEKELKALLCYYPHATLSELRSLKGIEWAANLEKQAARCAALNADNTWAVVGFCRTLMLASRLLGRQQKLYRLNKIAECRMIPVSVE